jgi:hypothetical protein
MRWKTWRKRQKAFKKGHSSRIKTRIMTFVFYTHSLYIKSLNGICGYAIILKKAGGSL